MTALNLFLGGWALFWTFTLVTISGIAALTGSHSVALFILAFASYAYWGGISARLLVVKQLPHASLIPGYQARVNASLKTLALLSLLPVVFFIPDPTMMAAALGVILTVAVVSVCALFSGFINALLSILAVAIVVTDMFIWPDQQRLTVAFAILGIVMLVSSPWLMKKFTSASMSEEKLGVLRQMKSPTVWSENSSQSKGFFHPQNSVKGDVKLTQSNFLSKLIGVPYSNRDLFLIGPLLLACIIAAAVYLDLIDLADDGYQPLYVGMVGLVVGLWGKVFEHTKAHKKLLSQSLLLPTFNYQSDLRKQLFWYWFIQQCRFITSIGICCVALALLTAWSWHSLVILFGMMCICSFITQLVVMYAFHSNDLGSFGSGFAAFIACFVSFIALTPLSDQMQTASEGFLKLFIGMCILLILLFVMQGVSWWRKEPVWCSK